MPLDNTSPAPQTPSTRIWLFCSRAKKSRYVHLAQYERKSLQDWIIEKLDQVAFGIPMRQMRCLFPVVEQITTDPVIEMEVLTLDNRLSEIRELTIKLKRDRSVFINHLRESHSSNPNIDKLETDPE